MDPKQKPKSIADPTAFYMVKISEDVVSVESANIGKTVEKKDIETKEFLLQWQITTEKVPVKLDGWLPCGSTEGWIKTAINSEV